jgi:predicted phosphohydrolase
VRGNHDYWWKNISGVRAALKRNIFALQNDSIRVDGFVICGTRGWVVPNPLVEASAEDLKIFNREIERLKLSLKSTSAQRKDGDILIVMMHYPPFGDSLGDSSFTSLFEEYKVSKVVYGHLHGNHIQIPLYIEKGTVEYYLTSCDKVNNTLVRIG